MLAPPMSQATLLPDTPPFEVVLASQPTPIERVQVPSRYIWAKRDDLYVQAGIAGGKVRTCKVLVDQAVNGVVTAGSRHSPQVSIVARLAAERGLPCAVFVPWATKEYSPELQDAAQHGATIYEVRPGHNSVINARAREWADDKAYTYVPFGMECWEAVRQTCSEYLATTWPKGCFRLVVPVGSGMTLAGLLWGQQQYHLWHGPVMWQPPKILGIQVGADPSRRLARYAPRAWPGQCEIRHATVPYSVHLDNVYLYGSTTKLDPVYEAKAAQFLADGDCLWVVGIRATV